MYVSKWYRSERRRGAQDQSNLGVRQNRDTQVVVMMMMMIVCRNLSNYTGRQTNKQTG